MRNIADFRHAATAVALAAAVALLPACGGDDGTSPAVESRPLGRDGAVWLELGALLELMQNGPLRADDLSFACAVADLMLEQFEDPQRGGFHFTSNDHETLVLRPKSGHDGALPSGNGMAALHLQRLGHLIGEPRYLAAAQRTMALFGVELRRAPHAYATLVDALAEYRMPPTLVLLSGPSAAISTWHAQLDGSYRPGVLTIELPDDTTGLPQVLAKPVGGGPQAWVCRGPQCLPPLADIESLLACLTRDEADA